VPVTTEELAARLDERQEPEQVLRERRRYVRAAWVWRFVRRCQAAKQALSGCPSTRYGRPEGGPTGKPLTTPQEKRLIVLVDFELALRDLLQRMPRAGEAFVRKMEGWTHKDIERAMKVTEGTSQKHVYRAMRFLWYRLEDYRCPVSAR